MARKSNKTAHVLNLLSGQDTNEEPEKEPEQAKEASKTEGKAETAKAGQDVAPAPAPVQAQAPAPEVPSNISIIDNGAKEADPLAERIHEELLKELEQEEGPLPEEVKAPVTSAPVESKSKASTTAVAAAEEPKVEAPTAPVAEAPKAEPPTVLATETPKAETPTTPAAEAPKAEDPTAPVTEVPKTETPAAPMAAAPKAETPAAPAVEEPKTEIPTTPATEAPKAQAPTTPVVEEPEEEVLELSPEPPKKPEPDYVMLNVMQRVVEDKIIYFMKQFEVCICDRCKADTIALTLSGLPAKYRIVDKSAVDPLVSYYTSRLISQVTVEALKACTQVKDNPRH